MVEQLKKMAETVVYFGLAKLVTCGDLIEVLSTSIPSPGFQGDTLRHTAITKMRKYDIDWVTINPTHYDPSI